MAEISWTDAEREAVRDELAHTTIGSGYYAMSVGVDEAREMADEVLAALAPFVAAREAQAAAKALRDAAAALELPKADDRWSVDLGYYGEAHWLRERADRIERGESDGR